MTCQFHKIFPSGTPFAAPSALRTLWNNRLKTWESPFSEVSLPRALFYDERHTLGKPSGRLHGNWIPSAFTAAGAASGGGEACPWIFFSEYDIMVYWQANSSQCKITKDYILLVLVWWPSRGPPGSLEILHVVLMATRNKDVKKERQRVFISPHTDNNWGNINKCHLCIL